MNKKLVSNIITVLTIAGLTGAFIKYVDVGGVVIALRNFNYAVIPLMLITSGGVLFLKALRFVYITNPITRDSVNSKQLFTLYAAGQAMTVFPGGVAGRAALMTSIGIPVAQTALPIILSSLLDQAFFLLGAMFSMFFIEQTQIYVFSIIGSLIALAILLTIKPARNALDKMFSKLFQKINKQHIWNEFKGTFPKVMNKKTIVAFLTLTILANILAYLTLVMGFYGANLELPLHYLLIAFVLPEMLGRIIPVPGGIGVTETSLIGILKLLTKVNINIATAATILYRSIYVFFQALIGAVVYFTLWKGRFEYEHK